jgi:hypothetical protein
MRIDEIAGNEFRSVLIGDVEPDAFNPVTTSRSVHVGLMIDVFNLRVVPVITVITATTEKERDALARAAICDHRSSSRGVIPLFGPIASYALIEPSRSGHLIAPYDIEGKQSGPLREVNWLGEVMITVLPRSRRVTGDADRLVA